MKRLYSTMVAGRRAGEEPEWKFNPVKLTIAIVVPIVTGIILYWIGWVSICSIAGDAAKKTVDVQVPVLHGRISGQELKRDAAVATIVKKVDDNQAAQTLQFQAIMEQLIEIRKDMAR